MKDHPELKILLAEDNKINQRLFSFTLAQMGYKCDLAANGLEAFNLHRQNNYEVIFMDMHMPVVDGLEATGMIREYEAENGVEKRVTIIALTASVFLERKNECLEAGMDDFMEKPLQNMVLKTVLDRFSR